MTSERFGFDVNMFYLARTLGYRVREVPVVWRNSPHSQVRPVRDSLSMLGELWRLTEMVAHEYGQLHPPDLSRKC